MRALVFVLVLVLPTIRFAQAAECNVGEQCSVHGVLRIWITPPTPTAILEIERGCIPLALPASVFADHEQWRGKSVTVVGLAYAHHVAENLLSYELKGRWVIGSLCDSSPIALFVDDIRAE
jgi:hypothetical protein